MAIVNTIFASVVEKWFNPIVAKVNEKINDKNEEPNLLFKQALVEELSTDMRWDSTDFNQSIYLADVVSLDSSLPLRKRDSVQRATGLIPKVGHKAFLSEKVLSDLFVLQAKGVKEEEIVKKVLNDVPRLVKGIEYLNELTFEQALSTGVCIYPSLEGASTGIRLNFGYKDDNFLKVANKWSTAQATPLSDIERLITKAKNNGDSIGVIWLSKTAFNRIRTSEEGKILAANYAGQIFTNSAKLLTPPQSRMINALRDEYGVEFIIVDSTFRRQSLSGGYNTATGWEEEAVVGTATNKVGRLVYSATVEEQRKVESVTYSKAGSYILVSKWSDNDPIKEWTGAQALVCPVIDQAESIYVLKSETLSE